MNTALYRENYCASPSNPELKPIRILRHRLNKPEYTVKFRVELANGFLVNLTERELQVTDPEVVYGYWESYVGGRCSITRYDKWHPLQILAHRQKNGTLGYKIQWVGYTKKEATWETSEHVVKCSEVLKVDYDKATWRQGW